MVETSYAHVVCEAIVSLAERIQMDEVPRLNERHLHHAFSLDLQQKGVSLGIDNTQATLHPEWPTRKKGTGIWYTVYAKRDGKYVPDDPNTGRLRPGFLDFAIGTDYQKPLIGVEFTLKGRWDSEEITYDLVKLMDPVLPFELGASLNIILRRGGKDFAALNEHLERAYFESKHRLTEARGEFQVRDLCFVVVEILEHKRQYWLLTADGNVQEGLPTSIRLLREML